MELAQPTARLEAEVKARKLPTHVGIIMDGNGRWAEHQGLSRIAGHREGSKSVRVVTRAARRIGVRALTLYAFSSQNWARPAEEVAALMQLLREYLESERTEILENQIRLNAVGELDKLPNYVRLPLEKLREESAHHQGMVLTLALSYGGREEILQAAARVAREAVTNPSVVDRLSANDFEKYLWTQDLPELDLVIRTSGEQRISNFLLWQAAYAELYFTDLYWPDFRDEAFFKAIESYQLRQRRFGLISSQVANVGR